MLFGCLLVEASTTEIAFSELVVLRSIQDFLLLIRWHVVFAPRLLQSRPELQRLCLPFGHFLFSLLLLKLFVHQLPSLHELLLLVGHDPLVLGVKLFSLFLEDLPANSLMLCNAVRVKLPIAAFAAHDELRWVILLYLYPIFPVDLLYAFLLGLRVFLGLGRLSVVLLLSLGWVLLVGVFVLVGVLLIVGDIAFLLEGVGIGVGVDILVGVGLSSIFVIVLVAGRVVVGVLIVISGII